MFVIEIGRFRTVKFPCTVTVLVRPCEAVVVGGSVTKAVSVLLTDVADDVGNALSVTNPGGVVSNVPVGEEEAGAVSAAVVVTGAVVSGRVFKTVAKPPPFGYCGNAFGRKVDV